MKNEHIRYYWLGFLAAAAGVAWLIWFWHKQREVTPKPLYITGRTAAYPMTDQQPVMPEKKPDNLTLIQGIGPSYARRLNEAGIVMFTQLADADAEELVEITGVSRWNPEDWIEQARQLARGD